MANMGTNLHVTVTLKDVDLHDPIPERTLVLSAPTWQVKIGRGTQSGYEGLTPAPNNAWFDSRVMSRSHALLRADPISRELSLEDTASMHGTTLAGKRMTARIAEPLWPNDTLVMGADVTRGTGEYHPDAVGKALNDLELVYFNALKIKVTWKWSDDSSIASNAMHSNRFTNTFSADYSEDEMFDEQYVDETRFHVVADHYDENESEEEDYEIHEIDGQIPSPADEAQIEQFTTARHRSPSIELAHPEDDYEVHEVNGRIPSPADEAQIAQYSASQACVEVVRISDSEDESDEASSSVSKLSGDDTSVSSPVVPDTVKESDAAKKSKIVTLVTSQPLAAARATVPLVTNPTRRWIDDMSDSEDLDFSDLDDDSMNSSSGELEDEYSESLEPTYIPLTQAGAVGPNDAAATVSTGSSRPTGQGRAPSPSDAAMVKPLGEGSNPVASVAPPFPVYQGYGPSTFSMYDTINRSNSAWAGHNSVLYDSVPPPMVWNAQSPFYYHAAAPWAPLEAANAPTPPQSSQLISHDSIVTYPQSQVGGSRKRKADHISTEEVGGHQPSPELGSSERFEQAAGDSIGILAGSAAARNLPEDATLPIDDSIEATLTVGIDGPPRKKAKNVNTEARKQSDRGLLKMAAATATGMAVGVVGTILGLAALPQDYFI